MNHLITSYSDVPTQNGHNEFLSQSCFYSHCEKMFFRKSIRRRKTNYYPFLALPLSHSLSLSASYPPSVVGSSWTRILPILGYGSARASTRIHHQPSDDAHPAITMPMTSTMTAATGCPFSCTDDDDLVACGKFAPQNKCRTKVLHKQHGTLYSDCDRMPRKKFRCKNLKSYVSYCKGLLY